jgi:hypothetical protein
MKMWLAFTVEPKFSIKDFNNATINFCGLSNLWNVNENTRDGKNSVFFLEKVDFL